MSVVTLMGVFAREIMVRGRIIESEIVALYSGSSIHGNNFLALLSLRCVATNTLTTVRRLNNCTININLVNIEY